jgi:uncharacterized protein
MNFEQSFTVAAPLAQVWSALVDIERVAPCLPGAEITGTDADGTYHGTFSVKLGPATASYRGTLKIEEVDEDAHRVTMRASGSDKRGQGGAKALMHSVVRPRDGGGTHVDVETDLTITGRLASFSRGGMMKDISNRLLGEFASCLQETLASDRRGGAAAPEATGPAETTSAAAGPVAPGGNATGPGTQAHPTAKPISGLGVLFGALWDRVRRLFGRKARSGR